MDELVVNPDGCKGFEPNQFKKEKCKNCGRSWIEHKGAISQEQVQSFQKQKQKVIDDQKQKEAEAKDKARAKAIAKKKQNQAAEDEWLFDGVKESDIAQDSDSDGGFKMHIPEEVRRPAGASVESKQLKVRNLIDFSACDVASEEIMERPQQEHPYGAVASRLPVGQEAALPGCPIVVGAAPAGQGFAAQPAVHGADARDPGGGAARDSLTAAQPTYPDQALQEELLAEIEHLRQMLADANEEKNIQVAIVRDEVIEKQQLVEDLTRQRVDTEVQLRDARDRVATLEAHAAQVATERDEALALAEKRRAEAELRGAEAREVEHLRAELAELTQVQAAAVAQLREAPPAAAEVPPSVAGILHELHELCSRAQEALGGGGQLPEQGGLPAAAEDAADAGEFEAGLRGLVAELRAVHTAAQHAGADRRQLAAKLRDLEKALLTKRSIHSEPTPMRNGVAASEEHAAAQDMGRQAAKALKEMRLSAESQLAWINKRIRMSSRQVTGGQVLSACLVRTDEAHGDRTTPSLTP